MHGLLTGRPTKPLVIHHPPTTTTAVTHRPRRGRAAGRGDRRRVLPAFLLLPAGGRGLLHRWHDCWWRCCGGGEGRAPGLGAPDGEFVGWMGIEELSSRPNSAVGIESNQHNIHNIQTTLTAAVPLCDAEAGGVPGGLRPPHFEHADRGGGAGGREARAGAGGGRGLCGGGVGPGTGVVRPPRRCGEEKAWAAGEPARVGGGAAGGGAGGVVEGKGGWFICVGGRERGGGLYMDGRGGTAPVGLGSRSWLVKFRRTIHETFNQICRE